MRFELLGTVGVRVDADQIVVSAGRDRIVLATLLLHANHTASTSVLVEAVWGTHSPANARNQLQGCVSRLRRQLTRAGASEGIVVTDPSGYRARVDPQDVDLYEFRRLRDAGRDAAVAGDVSDAVERYRSALALWRGPAVAGVDSALLRQAAATLDEERLRATEECIDIELVQGKAGELVPELTELVQQHPYQEKLHEALMLALYRAGRQADALAAYRRVRRALLDELGAEPGEDLKRLHRAILNRDPELDPPSRPAPPAPPAEAAVIPRELPPEVAAFTGRDDALRALHGMLEEPASPVVISAIAGTAGVGKTALAVHWAHRVADRFPDGQLYLNLRGYAAGPPLRPIDALAALLRSLGVPPEQIPTDETQAAGRYRSQLAGRRVLVVLDNAGSVHQVRPLLPGESGCLVLITSRDRLAGLVARDGARRLTLDVLPPDEAYLLLDRLLGAKQVDAERGAAEALARTCAYLPLALRIAAASLADHPHRSIADYLAELRSGDRLAMLAVDGDQETAVRATLDLSYQRIPAEARRLFRLLGLVPGPDFTPAAAAALAGKPVEDVRPLLTVLVSAHLLTEHAPGRYTFHDLLRLYAKQRTEAEDPADLRTGAVTRLFSWYLHSGYSAANHLYPQMTRLPVLSDQSCVAALHDASEALGWLEAEFPNLIAAIQEAADHGPLPFAWQLADSLRGYFWFSRRTTDWLTAASAALLAAERASDPQGQAAIHLSLAVRYQNLGHSSDAITHYNSALRFTDEAEWAEGRFAALGNLGLVYQDIGQLERAASLYHEALELNQKAGRLQGALVNSTNLGIVCQELGRLNEALAHHTRALTLSRQLESLNGEGAALHNLGVTYLDLGQPESALDYLTQALSLQQRVGDRAGTAFALDGLASLLHRYTDKITEALDNAMASVELFGELGDRHFESEALNTLGIVYCRARKYLLATECFERALDLARATGGGRPEIAALIGLAATDNQLNGGRASVDYARQALVLARKVGYRLLEGQALSGLAEVSLAQGAHEEAREYAGRALANHRETGHRPGEARALVVLGHLRRAAGDREAAQQHWRAAWEMFAEMGAQPPDDLPEVSGGGPG